MLTLNKGPHKLDAIKSFISGGLIIEEIKDTGTGKIYSISNEGDLKELPEDGLFIITRVRVSGSNNVVHGSISGFDHVTIGDDQGAGGYDRKNIVNGDVHDVKEFHLGDE